MTRPVVEVTTAGRGGSITYREGDNEIGFDWEFALPPTLALIWGPRAASWDTTYPWAAGRQRAVYELVGTEVICQQAGGCHVRFDLDAGTLDIVRGPAPREAGSSPAYAAFLRSVVPPWRDWEDGAHYDLAALRRLTPDEQAEAVATLASRDLTWREVEALSSIGTVGARVELGKALTHHLSIDTRLAAAEAVHGYDSGFDYDAFLARQIRALHQPSHGLARALRLARLNSAPAVRQALLWASYNQTECAPACAGLLLELTGVGPPPFEPPHESMLTSLGLHHSFFERRAAFEKLCAAVAMKLDEGSAD